MLKQTNLFYLQIFLHVYIQTLKMENTLIQYQILSVKYICPKPFFSFGWLCSSRAHISQKRSINLFITYSPYILNFLSTPDSSKYLKGPFGKVCPSLSICKHVFPGTPYSGPTIQLGLQTKRKFYFFFDKFPNVRSAKVLYLKCIHDIFVHLLCMHVCA